MYVRNRPSDRRQNCRAGEVTARDCGCWHRLSARDLGIAPGTTTLWAVTSPDIAPAIPPVVAELAASCVRFVHAAVGFELDFTHETLPLLDHYLVQARREVEARPEATPLVAQAMGAYFGQVVAAELTGFWRARGVDSHRWLLCLQPVFLALNPIGVGYDVLFRGQSHSGPSPELLIARDERQLVEQRLLSLPPEAEDDYYTFATRFDALNIAVEALAGQMHESGLEDVTFELGDYEDEYPED